MKALGDELLAAWSPCAEVAHEQRTNSAGRKTLEVAGFLEEFEKDEIKARVDIVSLFDSFGVKLVSEGKGLHGKCPWHEDREPSLSVDREKGLYHCFGCGEAGDVVSLVEKMKGVGFREALEYLRAYTGSTLRATVRRRRGGWLRASAATQASERAPLSSWTMWPSATPRTLLSHTEAARTWPPADWTSPQLITEFKLGYGAGTLGGIAERSAEGRARSPWRP